MWFRAPFSAWYNGTMRIALFALVLTAFPFLALAHGSPYFEFAPDISYRIALPEGAALVQSFIPQNDFLKGIDLWLDNPGAPAPATIELRTEFGTLIISKAVTVPAIAPVWSGARLHADFPNQLTLAPGTAYELRVVSGMPELGVYVADRAQLLIHNSQYYSEYLSGLVGSASLNNTAQEFAAKFALYEITESVPPTLSNVTSTVLSPMSARISFNANEPVDFRADAAPDVGGTLVSAAYTGAYQACGEELGLCALTLTVSPSASYQFTLFARDAWGNESSANGSFTTPEGPAAPGSGQTPPAPIFIVNPTGSSPPPPPAPGAGQAPPDTTPPTILNAHAAGLTANAVTIAWSTNEAANSELIVRLGSAAGAIVAAVSDATYELEHVLTAPGLAAGTAYAAAIRSTDPAGNANSLTLPFTTPLTSSGQAPATSSGQGAPPAQAPPPVGGSQPSAPPQPAPSGTTPSPAGGGTSSQTPQLPGLTLGVTPLSAGTSPTATATIAWTPPPEGEPDRGFRVDIFDEEWNIAAQVIVPTGTHEVAVPRLAPGTYRVVVYENRGGILRKIAEPAILVIAGLPFYKQALFLWSFFAFLFLIAGTATVAVMNRMRRMAKRKPKPEPGGGDFIKYGQ